MKRPTDTLLRELGMQILGPAEGADDTRKRMVRSVD